ncbi:hypothetical protein MLD38_037389 [Melastoma candidum]|uniref:Uncharacterized protein n=1 Tax=Melastoma candidum TaxID=119954 RepID=A0ACB9LN52_9MYRT|nr:hypothetical protein MLD38_037389 [Melastoma candidum]
MRVHDQEVTFNICNAMSNPNEIDECSFMDVNDEILYGELFDKYVVALIEEWPQEDEPEDVVTKSDEVEIEQAAYMRHVPRAEPLERPISAAKPSIEEPQELELKPLLEHLRYSFLGSGKTLPVIISAALSNEQEEELLQVLREHKTALGWSIADIKGISPMLCMHKIRLEDNKKASIEQQRRLNPNMKEVCVPKKGGMTVVENEKNELIPMRTVTGYNEIAIAPEDQEKATFTCSYGTFAFRRMPFGLCNTPATFQSLQDTNWDLTVQIGKQRLLQLDELEEFRLDAYENSRIYKDKTKKLHDQRIKDRQFKPGKLVLLFNSRLKLFSGKLKSRWSGPFKITQVFPYGALELERLNDQGRFKVNASRVKHYLGGSVDQGQSTLLMSEA